MQYLNLLKILKSPLTINNLFDLQKVFDTVNHNILLNKLSHYGIRNTENNLFSSYLAYRNQFVTINGFHSDLENV